MDRGQYEGMEPKGFAQRTEEAMANGNWMKGMHRMASVVEIDQFLALWERLQRVILTDVPDSIGWTLSTDGNYSASSAYSARFIQNIRLPLFRVFGE